MVQERGKRILTPFIDAILGSRLSQLHYYLHKHGHVILLEFTNGLILNHLVSTVTSCLVSSHIPFL